MQETIEKMFLFGQVPEVVSYGMMAILGILFLVCLSKKEARLVAFLSIVFILGSLYWMTM